MNQPRALPGVLEVLDDGLRLYRRHLGGFVLVSTAVLVVLAMIALSFMAFVRSEIGDTTGWQVFAVFALLVLGYPLLLYSFAALSRAAAASLDGNGVVLRRALRLNPARGCGMIVFNMLWSVGASFVTGILFMVLACPLSFMSLIGLGAVSAVTSSGPFGASLALFGILSQISWLWWLATIGAWLTSLVFAVQSFVQETGSWSRAASRAFELFTARFGQSLLMFIGAGAIFGTLSIAYLGSLVTLVVTVQERFGVELPPLMSDVIFTVLSVGSFAVLLPPLPIWMTMFYRHLARERDGDDFGRQVATWYAQFGQRSA